MLVAPYRHPIVLGKVLATIEQFAPGRLMCGLGSGWMREEFDALDVPFAGRGVRMDEYVAALRTIWSGTPAAFDGSVYRWEAAGFNPAPTRRRSRFSSAATWLPPGRGRCGSATAGRPS